MSRSRREPSAPFILVPRRVPSSAVLAAEWLPPPPPPPGTTAIWSFNLARALYRLDRRIFPAEWYADANDVLDGIPVVVMLDRLARYAAQALCWTDPIGHDPMRYGVMSAVPRWGTTLLERMRAASREARIRGFPPGRIHQVHWEHAHHIADLPPGHEWCLPARPGEPYDVTRVRALLAAVVSLAYADPPRIGGRRQPAFAQLDPRWHWVIYEGANARRSRA